MFSRLGKIEFPRFSNTRCLMMPFIQGHPESVPYQYRTYWPTLSRLFINIGALGFLTIDESGVDAGKPHRGARAKHGRALHTEAGRRPDQQYGWGDGGGNWGGKDNVRLAQDTEILIASSMDGTCAVWDATHEDTSEDGDIGHLADQYPYEHASVLEAGEVARIGILTPHESLPVKGNCYRQFLRIVGEGVTGREPYFTTNPYVSLPEAA